MFGRKVAQRANRYGVFQMRLMGVVGWASAASMLPQFRGYKAGWLRRLSNVHAGASTRCCQPKSQYCCKCLAGTACWRTDLYSGDSSGTLMPHTESIAMFARLGVKITPELKSASVSMPFDGFTQKN